MSSKSKVFAAAVLAATIGGGAAQAANVDKTFEITYPTLLVAGPGGAKAGGTVESNLVSGAVIVNALGCATPFGVIAGGNQFEVIWPLPCLLPGDSYRIRLTADGPFELSRVWFINAVADTFEGTFVQVMPAPGFGGWAMAATILFLGSAGLFVVSRRRPLARS